jgi:hypothetical protein
LRPTKPVRRQSIENASPHCADKGAAHRTLLRFARELLAVAEWVDVSVGKSVIPRSTPPRSNDAALEANNGHTICLLRWQPHGCVL